MKTNDPIELALTRRPSDEREYSEPMAPLSGSAGERVRPEARVHGAGQMPRLAAAGLVLVVAVAVLGSLALRNAAPAGPSPIGTSSQPEPLVGCWGQEPGFSPSLLAGAGDAETADAPGAAALRRFTAAPSDYSLRAWHVVSTTPDEVRFLARSGDSLASEYYQVVVQRGATGEFAAEGWFVATYGSCSLQAVPPDGYGTATWTLDPSFAFTAADTELHILVAETACHGTEPTAVGRIRADVAYGGTSIVVTVTVKLPEGAQECPLPPPAAYTVQLREPLGKRGLFDGGPWPAALITGDTLPIPTPTPAPAQPVVSIRQSGLTRTYYIAGQGLYTESEPFTLDTGLYYMNVACSQGDGAAGAAIIALQQVGSDGAVVGEPYKVTCSAPAVSPLFGETRRLTGGSYRLDVPSNTTSDITFEIAPGSASPALPRATVAPPAPLVPAADAFDVPCPGTIGEQTDFPCQAFDLSWLPSDPDAFYRIYESQAPVGTPQTCDPATAELIIATSVSIGSVRTGIYIPKAESGGICFYVAAVNSAGESARVRLGAPVPDAGRTFMVYMVKSGDTLADIAAKFGISYEHLLAANPQITDPSRIHVGQAIYIPWANWIPPTPGP